MKRILATFAIAAALLFGCGESRQEKFERALREAEAARVDLEAEREQVKQREAGYEQARKAAERAESELEAARGDVASASDRLEAARAEVLKWAPPDMLPPEMGATLPGANPTMGDASTAPADAPAKID
jgi:uncharacterized protein (DUF3084 family)